MKRLTSLSDIAETTNQFDSQAVEEVKRKIIDNLDSVDLTIIAKKYQRRLIGFILSCILTLIFIILIFVVRSQLITFVMLALSMIVVCVIWYFGIIPSIKTKWKLQIAKTVDQVAMLGSLIESTYDNIKLLRRTNGRGPGILARYRTAGIPGDARLVNDHGGFEFLLNGHLVTTRKLTWMWYQVISSGRGTTYREVYRDNLVWYSNSFDQRFNDFTFELKLAKVFKNQGKELENEAFNKTFSYYHNDPIKLRILFTPFVQETFVNHLPIVDNYKSMIWTKAPDYYVLVKLIDRARNPFEIDVPLSFSQSQIIESIIKEVIGDAALLVQDLALLASARELQRSRN